jgi:hypothetical protein
MSLIIILFKWIIPIGICLLIVDRLASPGSLSTVFLEIHSILEPSKKVTIKEIRKIKHEEAYTGDLVNDDDKREPSTDTK